MNKNGRDYSKIKGIFNIKIGDVDWDTEVVNVGSLTRTYDKKVLKKSICKNCINEWCQSQKKDGWMSLEEKDEGWNEDDEKLWNRKKTVNCPYPNDCRYELEQSVMTQEEEDEEAKRDM